jgi:Uma2 family endonuclease
VVEAEVRPLGEYLAVPDLAGWRVDRISELPDENPIPIAPDWACEILSPTTARDDRRLKLPLYARAGVGWIWLLDTEARQVEIYETVGERATFAFAAAEQAKLPPFDHAFDVATWFASPAVARATAATTAKRAAKTARPRQR